MNNNNEKYYIYSIEPRNIVRHGNRLPDYSMPLVRCPAAEIVFPVNVNGETKYMTWELGFSDYLSQYKTEFGNFYRVRTRNDKVNVHYYDSRGDILDWRHKDLRLNPDELNMPSELSIEDLDSMINGKRDKAGEWNIEHRDEDKLNIKNRDESCSPRIHAFAVAEDMKLAKIKTNYSADGIGYVKYEDMNKSGDGFLITPASVYSESNKCNVVRLKVSDKTGNPIMVNTKLNDFVKDSNQIYAMDIKKELNDYDMSQSVKKLVAEGEILEKKAIDSSQKGLGE